MLDDTENYWTELIKTWNDRLLLYARQYLPRIEDAEEAVQNAWLKFWNLKQKDNSGEVAPLLYLCTRQVAIDYYNSEKQRKYRERNVSDKLTKEDLFTCPIEAEEFRQDIEEALNTLSQEQKEVVIMKIWGELTFAQIAEILNESSNTIASRYRYALNKIRSPLEGLI